MAATESLAGWGNSSNRQTSENVSAPFANRSIGKLSEMNTYVFTISNDVEKRRWIPANSSILALRDWVSFYPLLR